MSSVNAANSLGQMAASLALTRTPPAQTDTPAKIKDAAQQFEALLLAQILHSAHESGGWLGSGGDSSSDSLGDYAEQQLAAVMAKNGGLGLARMIAQGLERKNNSSQPAPTSP